MLFSAVLYLTSTNIESYLVISGPLSRNETYTGLALREESVHQAETSGLNDGNEVVPGIHQRSKK